MNYIHTFHHYLKDAGVRTLPRGLPDFPMLFVPRQSQVTALNRIMREPRFGLFDDAGVGKTMPMQAWAIYNKALGNRCVCLMPPILLDQFLETIQDNYRGVERYLSWQVIDKGPAWRQKQFAQWDEHGTWPDMLLMTYAMFARLHRQRIKKKDVTMFSKRDSVLWNRDYRVVITDEAQALRGSESAIHALIMNYTQEEAESALLLATGTPLHHTPLDGYAMTRLTNRSAYESLQGFKRKHCNITKFVIQKKVIGKFGRVRIKRIHCERIDGFKDMRGLNRHLYKHARRVEKSEVLSLQEPNIIPVPLHMARAHRTLYNTMARERMLEMEDDQVLAATHATQLREYLMGIACNPNAFSPTPIPNVSFDMVRQLLDSIGPDKKVVLYAHHNETIEALADFINEEIHKGSTLDKEAYPEAPVLVYGGARSSDRKNRAAVSAFKKDPNVKLMLAHPQSGGVGLDLQHVCHTIIFVEPTSIHGDFMQVLARVQRSGQQFAVVTYVLVIDGTVYPDMVERMLDNNDLASKVNCDVTSFRKWIYGSAKRAA